MSALQYKLAYPEAGSYNVTTNADNARLNAQAQWWALLFSGKAAGVDVPAGGYVYNASGQLASVTYQESAAHAAADVPSRGASNRRFGRVSYTYSADNLSKVRYEFSVNSGSSWANATDLAGNAYLNYVYVSNRLDSQTWSTT